jgi:hypothetical protein
VILEEEGSNTDLSTDNEEACPVHRLQPVRPILGKEDFVFDFASVSQLFVGLKVKK